ncbi:MAG: aminoacetone oxidase family FAD-binding enzyme, partial [Bacteroidales bacterium]
FFKTLFNSFSNRDTITFFEELGLSLEVLAGGRVFPTSKNAIEVVDALAREMKRAKVVQHYNCPVEDLILEEGRVKGVATTKGVFECGAVIVATGGLSYPLTGSNGDGYRFATKAGHTIIKTFPSLTALKPSFFNNSFVGIILKNLSLQLFIDKDSIVKLDGDIEFTQNGMEGSLANSISRRVVKAKSNGSRCFLEIDLKPGLHFEQLQSRVERELKDFKGYSMHNFLKGYLPLKFIAPFVEALKLPHTIKGVENSGEIITAALKQWRFELLSYNGYQRAIVTAGGVSTGELEPKTMRSMVCNNLFFAGEVVDLDGDTGGYNLQIAFSSGFVAGRGAAYLISKL